MCTEHASSVQTPDTWDDLHVLQGHHRRLLVQKLPRQVRRWGAMPKGHVSIAPQKKEEGVSHPGVLNMFLCGFLFHSG